MAEYTAMLLLMSFLYRFSLVTFINVQSFVSLDHYVFESQVRSADEISETTADLDVIWFLAGIVYDL